MSFRTVGAGAHDVDRKVAAISAHRTQYPIDTDMFPHAMLVDMFWRGASMGDVNDGPADDLGPVMLRAITDANRGSVEALRVAADQEGFVDGVGASLAEAAAKPHAKPWHRAVYAGDVPVGFVMLSDGVSPGDTDWPWPHYLWRFLIDARFQRRGFGRAALDLVVAYLITRPGADLLMTSVVPGDGSPLGFYLRYGFRPTGENLGHEQVLQLRLTDEAP